jgi:hemolysin activation/secretion protein
LAGGGVVWRQWHLWSELQWHRIFGGGYLDAWPEQADRLDLRRLRAGLDGRLIDRWGNEYLLRGRWVSCDRQAPLEWKSYLGDYATLRGFPAGEIAGDQAGWASLDVRWGVDLFGLLHVPLLGGLGLQPIAFVDYGRALQLDGPLDQPWRDGWRADAGFGFGKLVGVPGRMGHLRLYLARPIGEGMGGRDWRVLLAFEN